MIRDLHATIQRQAEEIERLKAHAEQAVLYENTIHYAQQMFDRLPFDYGSNDFFESCDQIVREVERLSQQKAALRRVLLAAVHVRDAAVQMRRCGETGTPAWVDALHAGTAATVMLYQALNDPEIIALSPETT